MQKNNYFPNFSLRIDQHLSEFVKILETKIKISTDIYNFEITKLTEIQPNSRITKRGKRSEADFNREKNVLDEERKGEGERSKSKSGLCISSGVDRVDKQRD